MFSLKKGRPIAKFINGKFKGKCTLNILDEDDNSKYNLGNQVTFKDSIFPVPNVFERECIYIAAPSGSGKSTFVGKYLESFKKAFPDFPIFIISRKNKDPALDFLKPKRIIINKDLVTNPIDITLDIDKGACFVFDDVMTIFEDDIKKAVLKLMADILDVGREQQIYCIITNHLINPNEKKTARTIFNESHCNVIFPKSGKKYSLNYFLTKTLLFDKNITNKILELNSRWVLISNTCPNYVLHEHGAFII